TNALQERGLLRGGRSVVRPANDVAAALGFRIVSGIEDISVVYPRHPDGSLQGGVVSAGDVERGRVHPRRRLPRGAVVRIPAGEERQCARSPARRTRAGLARGLLFPTASADSST